MQLGLALSGGGFRATLFHLGVVKALLDRGVLKDVCHITSVSGGSILAAHLVLHWEEYTDPSRFDKAAREIVEFARRDVRGRVFRRLLLPPYLLVPYLANLRRRPRRLRRDGTVRNLLFERDLRALYGDVLLGDLPAKPAPRLDILTTNLTQGSLAYFSGGAFVPDNEEEIEIETSITVARAVMTSALFPGFFPTVEFNAENLAVDLEKFASAQYFTDGGVYDNLGIRRFQTVLSQEGCELERVLVSDASGAFDWLIESETLGYWKTALRSSEVFMKRLADLEYELAEEDKSAIFRFLRISEVTRDSTRPEVVQDQIKHIRTDLDRFSVSEIRALLMHGYEIGARATKGGTDAPAQKMVGWDPFPGEKSESETRQIEHLQRARFHSYGLFNWRDWPSYVYPVLLIVAMVLLLNWYQGQRVHWHYGEQTRVDGEIVDRVANPEKTKAIVTRAVQRPHRSQGHRVEAAFLAYALSLQQQDAASKSLLDAAKTNLDPQHLSRFHEEKWRHFHGTLPVTSFGFSDSSDPDRALKYAWEAVQNVPAQSRAQLEAALTSYGIWAKPGQDEVLKERALRVLERAKKNLDKPRLERFHQTKWTHFYSTLPITSFGSPKLTDPETALAYVHDAIEGLPQQSPLHVQTALTSYAIHNLSKDAKEASLEAFARTLEYLARPGENELSQIDQFRTTLMKGHYSLAQGNVAFRAAGEALKKGDLTDAAGKAGDAEVHYANAGTTYDLARSLHFKDLWGVHVNVSNAAVARADAACKFIASRKSIDKTTRQQLQAVIEANLLVAQKSGLNAHEVSPTAWQPSFLLGVTAVSRNKPEEAQRRFLEGYEAALRTGEQEAYVGYLTGRPGVKQLCRFTDFSRTFIKACR